MDILLRTNAADPALALRNVRSLGDGEAFECLLDLRSGGFALQREFWFEQADLVEFVKRLRKMDGELAGDAELRTRYEDNFVRIEVSSRAGEVTVSGVVREYGSIDQQLRFKFITDQTVLRPLADDLSTLVRGSAP